MYHVDTPFWGSTTAKKASYNDATQQWEVVVDRDGQEVLDGKYLAFHPDGSRAVQGRYELGQRRGTWRWWYPDGGRLQREGRYDEGLRVGEWRAWHADGRVDEAESGTCTVLDSRYPGEGRRRSVRWRSR